MSRDKVIVNMGLAGYAPFNQPNPALVGMLLASYDADGDGGAGTIEWTRNPDLALRFPSTAAAMAVWSRQSRTRPLRVDGEPNRPLTMFTVEVRDADAPDPDRTDEKAP